MKNLAIGTVIYGTGLVVALGLGTLINPIVYKTIGISEEAKAKVVSYATTWNMSQQDTVSKMVLEYGSSTPTTNQCTVDQIEYKDFWERWKSYFEESVRIQEEWKLREGY